MQIVKRLVALACLTIAGPTLAAGENVESSKLEEVVVTAQKKEERLQDVPVPVTALNAQSLIDNSQTRLADYFSQVPGLSYLENSGGQAYLTIRGLSTGATGSNPTVAVLVDDVPLTPSTQLGGGEWSADLDPNDLARVEVLRGPQGTLYGASSLGGLLKYVTVDPSTAGVTGHLLAGTTGVQQSDELGYAVSGSVNIPLGESMAVRASGFTREDPGYIDNIFTGQKDVNKIEASGGRLAFLWKPSDTFSLKLSALYQDHKILGQTNALGDSSNLEQSYIGGPEVHNVFQSYSATLTAKLGTAELTALTGYSSNKLSTFADSNHGLGFLNGYTDAAFGIPNNTTAAAYGNEIRPSKFSQELRLSMPLGKSADWLLGGYYTHENNPWVQSIYAVEPMTGDKLGTWVAFDWIVKYDEYAAFTDFTFHLTDQFDIQLGARESHIKQSYSEVDTGPFYPLFLGLPSPLTIPQVDTSDNAFTYLVTPQFRVSQDLMIYARLASGYRPGGPNATASPFGLPTSFQPDKSQNYELGTKGNIPGLPISFDASVYYIDWKNIQIFFSDPTSGFGYTENGPRAKSQGVELSAEATPASGLTLSAWFAYNDAKLTEDFPSSSAVYGFSGDRLPNSSRISGFFSVHQEFPVTGSLTGFAGGAINYIGQRVGELAPRSSPSTERQDYPGFAVTNLNVGLKYHEWMGNLFANNVADRRGILWGGLHAGGDPSYFNYIQPRTIGLTISRNF